MRKGERVGSEDNLYWHNWHFDYLIVENGGGGSERAVASGTLNRVGKGRYKNFRSKIIKKNAEREEE